MTKKQIKEMDAIESGKPCSVSLVKNGMSVAIIKQGYFVQRQASPVGFAWRVTRHGADIFILPTYKLLVIDGDHFRCDI
jgi:hypothetical protein